MKLWDIQKNSILECYKSIEIQSLYHEKNNEKKTTILS